MAAKGKKSTRTLKIMKPNPKAIADQKTQSTAAPTPAKYFLRSTVFIEEKSVVFSTPKGPKHRIPKMKTCPPTPRKSALLNRSLNIKAIFWSWSVERRDETDGGGDSVIIWLSWYYCKESFIFSFDFVTFYCIRTNHGLWIYKMMLRYIYLRI